GTGHHPGDLAVHLRALSAGGQLEHESARGPRTRSGPRQTPRRAARGQRRRPQCRQGAGLDIRGQAAGHDRPDPAPQSHPTASSMDALPEGARLDDLRVLVVDDDSDALELAAAMLKGAGASVRTCRSATEALEVLSQWRPHVLVSDIEMPGEDGYSLIK